VTRQKTGRSRGEDRAAAINPPERRKLFYIDDGLFCPVVAGVVAG